MQINATKVTLYVVLLILTIYCGRQFLARYGKLMTTEVDTDPYALNEDRPDSTNTASTASSNTNQTANVGATNGTPTSLTSTNGVADTNEPPLQVRPAQPEFLTKRALERGRALDTSGIALYAFGMFGVVIALGVLVAHDVSIFMGQRAHKLLHNDEGEGIHSAAYDKAEEVWANGDHLEAIKLMRDYLLKIRAKFT